MEEDKKIIIRAIIEMLGAPKDYIEKTLKNYLEKIKEDLDVRSTKVHEAQEQGKLFSCFADVEVAFDNTIQLMDFCFESMPSSIEIVKPEQFSLKQQDFTALLNDIQARLHENDMLLKNIQSAKKLLDQNAVNVFRNFITFALKQGESDPAKIGEIVGVSEKDLKVKFSFPKEEEGTPRLCSRISEVSVTEFSGNEVSVTKTVGDKF